MLVQCIKVSFHLFHYTHSGVAIQPTFECLVPTPQQVLGTGIWACWQLLASKQNVDRILCGFCTAEGSPVAGRTAIVVRRNRDEETRDWAWHLEYSKGHGEGSMPEDENYAGAVRTNGFPKLSLTRAHVNNVSRNSSLLMCMNWTLDGFHECDTPQAQSDQSQWEPWIMSVVLLQPYVP